MQPTGGSSLVRRKGSGLEENTLCALSTRCNERHFPVDCLLFRKLPVQHRISLVEAAGICKKCLSHRKRDDGRAEHCGGQHGEDHWMCRTFSDPEGPGIERRLLPAVKSQPGRLTYRCRTVIHVKSRSDLEADEYSVKLTTLYDSNQQQSYIRNEVAKKHVLRYVQVPERTVDISSAAPAKTTKLFILDVKPRSTTVGVGPEILSAYGVDGVELTLPEEFGVNELRRKFEKRPGLLTNSNVAQPEARVDVVVGRDNPRLMPVEALRSERDGNNLYVMRNVLSVGEMLCGETSGTALKKKGAAGSAGAISTPKQKQLTSKDPLTASKRPVKAAPVRTPAAAGKRPEAAEERAIAGPSGIKGGRRQDSSPALSVAASDTMVSSAGGAASNTPMRDGGRNKSSSREQPLVYAKKSRVREESSASETSAASPGNVAHGDSSSRPRAVTLEVLTRDSGDITPSEASSRDVSRDTSASSSRATGSKTGAESSSSSEDDNSSSEEEDSNSDSDHHGLEEAEKEVAIRVAGVIAARKQLKKADKQIEQLMQKQIERKKKKDELQRIAVERAEKEAAEKAEAGRKKLEADRQRDQQKEEQRKEERRREQAESSKRSEEDREARKRSEEDREARKRSEEDREARKRSEEDREARRRSEKDREARKRPEAGRAEDSWKGRHVRDRRVQDRLGERREEKLGRPSGPEEAGLRPDYTIPRKGRPWKTTTNPSRSLPLTYEGYTIALPRSEEEKLVFQQLLNRKLLFQAPEAGPDRCREPHFRFKSGESALNSERTDRRRIRSPEMQEAARKRHRDHKD
jgi:hypothetical protein